MKEPEHETDMPHCWCKPKVIVYPNGNMAILHNRLYKKPMKYIKDIDSYQFSKTKVVTESGDSGAEHEWVCKRPEQGHGLFWLKIRILMAWACLTGKADAVTFYKQ